MKKILVVEDNYKNRELLEAVLQAQGYRVITAVNGNEGIYKAKEHKPDLILMDIQMPRIDGFKAAKALKSDPQTSGLKIIAVTSFAMKGDREEILDADFDAYMSKPLDTRKLVKLVNDMIAC